MSRSVKQQKSHGFLDHVSKIRKLRKQAKAFKEQLLIDIDLTDNLIFAQEL